MSLMSRLCSGADKPLLMGIVNVTPDSFYDGGCHNSAQEATWRAIALKEAGADILDIGGESTRPGASAVQLEEEKRRVLPVIEKIRAAGVKLPISVDTNKAALAEAALQAGADIINDISALRFDSEMAALIAEYKVPVVLMHMQGEPRNMQKDPQYSDVVADVLEFFKERVEFAVSAGIEPENIIIDPGIGFGKKLKHNQELFAKIELFKQLDLPILVGHSRKSYLGQILGQEPKDRLVGTLASSAYLQMKSVDILRVHDVAAHVKLRSTINWISDT